MIETTLTFTERYSEYRHLGYPDWEIAKKMGMNIRSLARQLARYGLPVSQQLAEMIRERYPHNEQ